MGRVEASGLVIVSQEAGPTDEENNLTFLDLEIEDRHNRKGYSLTLVGLPRGRLGINVVRKRDLTDA